MRYQGGKARSAKQLAQIISLLHNEETDYIEPFCGSCAVGSLLNNEFAKPSILRH